MQIDKFDIFVKDGILIVTSKKNVTLEDLMKMKELMEESTGKKYFLGTYRDSLGYYDGYDFVNHASVYCGSLSEKVSIDRLKTYYNEKFKNNSNK